MLTELRILALKFYNFYLGSHTKTISILNRKINVDHFANEFSHGQIQKKKNLYYCL